MFLLTTIQNARVHSPSPLQSQGFSVVTLVCQQRKKKVHTEVMYVGNGRHRTDQSIMITDLKDYGKETAC